MIVIEAELTTILTEIETDGVDLLRCKPLLRLKEVYYSRTRYGTHIYTCTYKYYGMKTTVVELQIVPNY